MQDKILRLMPKKKQERIELLDFERKGDLFVNIYREEHSPDLRGYFLRSKDGAMVIVNNTLPSAEQASVIKTIINGISKCPSSELGIVKDDNKFRCGGHCCYNLDRG